MSRRTFTTEFNRQAVLLVLNEGIPVQIVAIKLEIHANTLYRWIKDMKNMVNVHFQVKEVMNMLDKIK